MIFYAFLVFVNTYGSQILAKASFLFYASICKHETILHRSKQICLEIESKALNP